MSVFFYGCVTIDGYLADRNHGLDWLYESGTSEETGYDRFYRSMDVTVMGRRTFDALEHEPGCPYPTTKNYVFTHAGQLSRQDFIPASGDPAEFVGSLDPRSNIWIVGGNTVLAPLLDRDMVDCMVIQTAPVLLGAGIPLFTQGERLRRFRLEQVNRYGQFAELVFCKSEAWEVCRRILEG